LTPLNGTHPVIKRFNPLRAAIAKARLKTIAHLSPLIALGQSSSAPVAIAIFIVTLLFVTTAHLPYHINEDAAILLKSAQQFAQGETAVLHSLVIPSAENLAQDQRLWIAWYSPGLTFLYYPLIALGLPIGTAAKITSYLLIVLGCSGWLTLAQRLGFSQLVRLIFALTVPIYAISVDGAIRIWSGEISVFAIMPWLYIMGFQVIETWQQQNQNFRKILLWVTGLGFCLGAVYWLKYSAFIPALMFCGYLTIELFFLTGRKRFSTPQKILIITIAIFAISLIPLGLSWLNTEMSHTVNYIDQAMTAEFRADHPRDLYLILFLLAVPILYLFQSFLFWGHFVFFSDSWIPFFREIEFHNRLIPLAIIVLPLSFALGKMILDYGHRFTLSQRYFFLFVGYFPFLPLAYLTQVTTYNYLVFNPRHGVGHYLVIEMLVIAIAVMIIESLWSQKQQIFKRIGIALLLSFLIILPNGFHWAYFIKSTALNPERDTLAGSENLYTPTLSTIDSQAVINIAKELRTKPEDIIAMFLNANNSFDVWLTFDGRVLPFAYSDEGFRATHGIGTLHVQGDRPLTTSQPLRIVLIVSQSIENDRSWFNRIQQRFPQAQTWQKQIDPALDGANVSIYVADLVP